MKFNPELGSFEMLPDLQRGKAFGPDRGAGSTKKFLNERATYLALPTSGCFSGELLAALTSEVLI